MWLITWPLSLLVQVSEFETTRATLFTSYRDYFVDADTLSHPANKNLPLRRLYMFTNTAASVGDRVLNRLGGRGKCACMNEYEQMDSVQIF